MPPAIGFVQRLGAQLLLNGAPYRIVGANNYYLGYAPASTVRGVLDLVQSFGMNSLRIWAFLDTPGVPGEQDLSFQYWDPAAQAATANEGPNGLERLDRALAEAAARGLRVILTLVNNWKDFGGMPQYLEWFHPGASDKNIFYLDLACRDAYKNWARTLILRRNTITGGLYRDDPAILAWELANEPRCECPGGVEMLLGWVREMSAFVRGLDPNHLIAVGDEGYFNRHFAWRHALYNGVYGVDCERLLGVPEVDFGTLHLYPELMAKDEDPARFGARWIREHLEAGRRADKPMLVEEYGTLAAVELRDGIFENWLDVVEEMQGVGGMLWMAGLPKGTDQWYEPDGYVIGSPELVPAVAAHARRMLGIAVAKL